MFGRRSRRASPFQGRARSERGIVYDGQIWSFAVLVSLLAVLTSPLWLFSPPTSMGSKNEFRLAGASVWAGLAVLAIFAGRVWGLCLTLNHEQRTVTRVHRSPWRVTTLWSYTGDRVGSVSLSVNAQGIARLEASLIDGSTLLVEKGVNIEDLRSLGADLALCWDVPFRRPMKYPES
jgi:hypothetical protein